MLKTGISQFGSYKLRHEKICIVKYAKTKAQISYIYGSTPLLSKMKFQASNRFLWLYSPICVGPMSVTPRIGFLMTLLNYIILFAELSEVFDSSCFPWGLPPPYKITNSNICAFKNAFISSMRTDVFLLDVIVIDVI